MPNTKAPQSAQNRRFTGCFYAGSGGRTRTKHFNYHVFCRLCQFPCQTNKKRAEHQSRPYEKSVHAVTFSSHIMNDIRPRDIINDTCCLNAVGLLEVDDLTQRLPTKVPVNRQTAESKLDPLDRSSF